MTAVCRITNQKSMDYISTKIKTAREIEVSPQLHDSIMRQIIVLRFKKPFYVATSLLLIDAMGHTWYIIAHASQSAKLATLKNLVFNFELNSGYFVRMEQFFMEALQSAMLISFFISSALLAYLVYLAMKFQNNSKRFSLTGTLLRPIKFATTMIRNYVI